MAKPGKSFLEMMALIIRGHHIPFQFSHQLLVAIFWEETFFNNRKQITGTAHGFGQVEPSEYRKFETELAKKNGYFIPGLPPRRTVGVGRNQRTELRGVLTDIQAVKVTSSALRHNFFTRKKGKRDALNVYGGVFFEGKSSLSKADRLKKIDKWLACEAHLRKIPDLIHWIGLEDHIIDGLQQAEGFKDREAEFRPLLFPKSLGPNDFLRIIGVSPFLIRLGSNGEVVQAVQGLLNFKRISTTPALVIDGIFGAKTHAGVQKFQRQQRLVADGIVGPKTKQALAA